ARYMESLSDVQIDSTRGVSGSFRGGHAMFMTAIVMREGESVKQGYNFQLENGFHALDPGRTAQESLEQVSRHLGARPLSTGRRRPIVGRSVTAPILGLLQFALSGKHLAEGRSLLRGKLGQRIAAERVTIVDDPDHPGGLANRPFDAEGTKGKRLVLVDKGFF